jgi:hypothetical protein
VRNGFDNLRAALVRAAACAVLALTTLAPSAGAAARPDVAVTALGDPVPAALAGTAVKASDTVGARSGRARATTTTYYLSVNKRLDRRDVKLRGARKVHRLSRGQSAKGTRSVVVPAKTKPGVYRLLACADGTRRIRESNERNNCRASKRTVAITPKPAPLRVQPALDQARAAEADIGPEGGSLSVTAADGTRMTLDVPAEALISRQKITMTPLSGLSGSPVPLAYGVHFEPSGLTLLRTATLTIQPAAPLPADQVAGFGYTAGGDEFHLQPVKGDGSALALAVRHFSGAGVARADAGARRDLAGAHAPSGAGDAADQAAAANLGLQPWLEAMYWNAIALSASRDTFPVAMQELDQFTALAPAVPAMAARVPLLRAQLAAALRRLIAESRQRCFANTDLSEAGQVLRLASYAPPLQDSQAQSDAAAAIQACVRFEVSMDARLEADVGDPVHMEVRAKGPVTLVSGFAPSSATGAAPLEVASYDVKPHDCWACQGTATPADPMRITNLRLSGLNVPGAPVLLDAVDIDGGSVTESITHICSEPDSEPFTTPESIFLEGFADLARGRTFSGWTPVGNGTFRTSRSGDAGTGTGTLDLELRHTPAP